MSLRMIFNRMLRNRRSLIVLLVAMCLVTGFFAFSPLYLRAVGEAALSYTIETTPPERFSLRVRSDARIDPAYEQTVQDTLGSLVTRTELITQSARFFCGHRLLASTQLC